MKEIPYFIKHIIFCRMSTHKNKDSSNSIKHLSTDQLKRLLSKLQNEHNILQAKNQQMTNQISDLRNAVKCVQIQRRQTVSYEVQRKKQLQNKVDSLEKGIAQALKNNHYEAMVGFKSLME